MLASELVFPFSVDDKPVMTDFGDESGDGQPKGIIFDGVENGYLEIKGGSSALSSTYKLRLEPTKRLSTASLFRSKQRDQ